MWACKWSSPCHCFLWYVIWWPLWSLKTRQNGCIPESVIIHPVQAPSNITYSHMRPISNSLTLDSWAVLILQLFVERERVHRRCVHCFFPKREITPVRQPEQTYFDVCQRSCPSHVDTMSILAFEIDVFNAGFQGQTPKHAKTIKIVFFLVPCFLLQFKRKWTPDRRCWIWIWETWVKFHFVPCWSFILRSGGCNCRAIFLEINLFSLNW